jgi:thiosulfate/3-mercaptopyruvate sulfurtransferase
MLEPMKFNLRSGVVRCGVLVLALGFGFALRAAVHARTGQRLNSETLPAAELVRPADLAKELASANAGSRPTIVYVGFRTLYAGGHIPGATFHGSASTEQGLAELKKWASTLPSAANVVIYCGCCPFERCPNVRPAFFLFREMGFTRVRVLHLPTSFAADWAEKGFPIEKGTS